MAASAFTGSPTSVSTRLRCSLCALLEGLALPLHTTTGGGANLESHLSVERRNPIGYIRSKFKESRILAWGCVGTTTHGIMSSSTYITHSIESICVHYYQWVASRTKDVFTSTHTPDFERVCTDELAVPASSRYGMRAGYLAATQSCTSCHQVISLHPAAPS